MMPSPGSSIIQNSSSSLKPSIRSDIALLVTDSALADITIGRIVPAGGAWDGRPESATKNTSVDGLV